MAGNDTAALVVALSAQLTKFEKDMKDAGGIADRTVSGIEDRFSRLNPAFSGSFLGNFASNFATKGVDAAIKFVTDLKDRFLELRDVAHLVGLSMNDIFGIQQAAGKTGTAVEDVTKSVRALAFLLDQMQRGEKNSLSALLDANPQALQGVNREALTLQQTFGVVANLVQNARTEIQKIDISAAAGQTESMVKFLQKGGDEVGRLSAAAAAAAPDLQKLADQAKAFDDAWKALVEHIKAYASEHIFDWFKTDLLDIVTILEALQKFSGLFKGGLIDKQAAEASSQIEVLRSAIAGLNKEREKSEDQGGARPRVVINGDGTPTRNGGRPLSNVPLKPQAKGTEDTFDRTEEQITKHTASINADTIAVSQNNAVRAQLRAEFTLLNALRKDESGVTQAQIDQYEKLRVSMTAEQALEQAHINLSPAHKASFIAASEGAKTATANYDAARESLNKLNSASSQLGSALSTAFADAVVEGKSLNDVMSSLLKTLEKAAINSVFASFFNPTAAGGLSPFASIIKGGFGFADGGYTGPGGRNEAAGVVHRGEYVINADATSKNRDLLEAINAGKPGFADGGYVGANFTPVSPGSGLAGKTSITVIDNVGTKVQHSESVDGRGNRSLQLTLDDAVAASMSRAGSATRSAMRNNFGASPMGVRR